MVEFVSSLCIKSDIYVFILSCTYLPSAKGCMIELLLGMARVKVNGVIMYLWELQYHLLKSFYII
jgi:uncharacterized membrane protein